MQGPIWIVLCSAYADVPRRSRCETRADRQRTSVVGGCGHGFRRKRVDTFLAVCSMVGERMQVIMTVLLNVVSDVVAVKRGKSLKMRRTGVSPWILYGATVRGIIGKMERQVCVL